LEERIRIIGDPVLRGKASAVERFNDALKDLAYLMYELMIEAEGVGLAAPQIGRSLRFLVTGLPREEGEEADLRAYANPVIIESEGSCAMEEGCLSVPEIREDLERPERILLSWRTLEGEERQHWFDGLDARVLQHELDHLEGILFVDRLSPARRSMLKGRLNRLQQR